ncbi:MAG: helix-turn-helix domain-containing protein [Planctomycetes bacterium]|nr:helix-turn-helix domain-containing protein [Planctomycetota bacterium]
MPPSSPITVQQAAEILDVAAAHVRLMIRRGRIAAVPFSGVWLVDAASVQHYANVYRQPTRGRPRKSKKTKRKTR